jgi:hypothetical protein
MEAGTDCFIRSLPILSVPSSLETWAMLILSYIFLNGQLTKFIANNLNNFVTYRELLING